MHFFPNDKIFINFGPLNITWYAIFILIGVAIVLKFTNDKFLKMGYSQKIFDEFVFYLVIIAIIGARFWYVIFEYHRFDSLWSMINLTNGGLAIHGGILFGTIYGIIYFKLKRINPLRIADVLFPFMMIGQAIGRIGNFINQEAYGRIVAASYYDYFPSFIKDKMLIDGMYREPTFLYESLLNILGFVLIYFVYKKYGRRKIGDLFFAYLGYYGIIRYIIESLRTDSLYFGEIRVAQLISIIFIFLAIFGILGLFDRFFMKKQIICIEYSEVLKLELSSQELEDLNRKYHLAIYNNTEALIEYTDLVVIDKKLVTLSDLVYYLADYFVVDHDRFLMVATEKSKEIEETGVLIKYNLNKAQFFKLIEEESLWQNHMI